MNGILARLSKTKLEKVLREQRTSDPEWLNTIDALIMEARFAVNPQQPWVETDDGLIFYALTISNGGREPTICLKDKLDLIVDKVCGISIYSPKGEWLYLLSPGDMVAYKLHGKFNHQWPGRWNIPNDLAIYQSESEDISLQSSSPSDLMLPPLAARSLHFAMRKFFNQSPRFEGRVPKVLFIQPSSTDSDPDFPCDMLINVAHDDLDSDREIANQQMLHLMRFVPRYLRRRMVFFGTNLFEDNMIELEYFVKRGGLEPAGEKRSGWIVT